MNAKSKPLSDESRWITIYPAYINSKKTKFEGRRIAIDKGVDNPTVTEIFDILNFEGLKVKVEKNKMYSRDASREKDVQGRIRVQLKNDDGTFANDKFKTRESLMLHAAALIPKLKSRQPGGAAPAPQTGGKKKKR